MNIQIQELTKGQKIYSGSTHGFLPDYSSLPEEFKKFNGNKWVRFVSHWFHKGIDVNVNFWPKQDVSAEKAWDHINYCMRSWEPKHEHKIAGCAFLLSEWFTDITDENDKSLLK